MKHVFGLMIAEGCAVTPAGKYRAIFLTRVSFRFSLRYGTPGSTFCVCKVDEMQKKQLSSTTQYLKDLQLHMCMCMGVAGVAKDLERPIRMKNCWKWDGIVTLSYFELPGELPGNCLMAHHLRVALLWLVLRMVVGLSMLQELGAVRSRLRHVSATPGAAPMVPGTISRPATVEEPDESGHCLSTNPVRGVLGGGSIAKGCAE